MNRQANHRYNKTESHRFGNNKKQQVKYVPIPVYIENIMSLTDVVANKEGEQKEVEKKEVEQKDTELVEVSKKESKKFSMNL